MENILRSSISMAIHPADWRQFLCYRYMAKKRIKLCEEQWDSHSLFFLTCYALAHWL